ncbi:hypothetical protein AVEN_6674-1 [Araneus ventricosus]|uniref:Uncharacterized protein n=1 Tax=Araneus ventricosus TaxID=182803 RepID=A0A4Y2JE04_ARAVE|nr:hypothetical protein AVEN_6674-1 [Araneus ventricosus]
MRVKHTFNEKCLSSNRSQERFVDAMKLAVACRAWCPSGILTALGLEDSKFETRFHQISTVYGACCMLNLHSDETPSCWCSEDQGPSLSYDRGSKLHVAYKIVLVLL